jgi:galactose mutarotase-like enzyme
LGDTHIVVCEARTHGGSGRKPTVCRHWQSTGTNQKESPPQTQNVSWLNKRGRPGLRKPAILFFKPDAPLPLPPLASPGPLCYNGRKLPKGVVNMIYERSNRRFTARVDSLGAQLLSLQDASGFEYIWRGDEAYWREHAPVLFPIVGALRQGKTRINGQWYEMARHGFAKRCQFALAGQTEDGISLRLTPSQETRAQYPFDFAFTVDYTLTEEGVSTRFTVENPGSRPLPFAVGGHPGFSVPVNEDAAFEDYIIRFDSPEEQACPVIDLQAGLIDWDKEGFRLTGSEIPLRHSLFYQDALVFEGLRSHTVQIVNPKTGKGVEMDFSGFPMLGVWSAVNDGPYVCLEPWTGCATLTSEGDEFTEKKGMTMLPPGERAVYGFAVRVL